MSQEERVQIMRLISSLNRSVNNMNSVLNRIKSYENSISRGILVNGEYSFNKELNDIKNTLTIKRDYLKNTVIPNLRSMI